MGIGSCTDIYCERNVFLCRFLQNVLCFICLENKLFRWRVSLVVTRFQHIRCISVQLNTQTCTYAWQWRIELERLGPHNGLYFVIWMSIVNNRFNCYLAEISNCLFIPVEFQYISMIRDTLYCPAPEVLIEFEYLMFKFLPAWMH